jgi:LysM repeat protein
MMIASTLALVIITTACERSASDAPVATFTPVPQSNVFEPIDNGSVTNIETLQAMTTSTALAGGAVTQDGSVITPQVATETPTPLVVTNPTITATLAVSGDVPAATAIPSGSRPASYTLQAGEFPFCIARRFNVDPDELLRLSGLSGGGMYPAGTVLRIPQSGSFPGDRMLRNHPATYTVSQAGETVYSIACAFGDVDPALIASNNGISVGATLTVGQTLNIP